MVTRTSEETRETPPGTMPGRRGCSISIQPWAAAGRGRAASSRAARGKRVRIVVLRSGQSAGRCTTPPKLHAGLDPRPGARIFTTVGREVTVETVLAIGGIVLGLVLLAGGGEGLVRGATTLARLAGVTPAVIGLTVVAMGTSLPELVVSVLASVEGRPDIAVGNVVGSNLFNVGAVLGVTALVAPLVVHGSAVRLEWPVMFVVSWLGLLLMRDGVV